MAAKAEEARKVSGRPVRFCDVCGQADDAPRHVVQYAPGETSATPPEEWLAGVDLNAGGPDALRRLMAGDLRERHLDCCAAQGCPTCQATEEITGGARDDELVALVTQPSETLDAVRAVSQEGEADG